VKRGTPFPGRAIIPGRYIHEVQLAQADSTLETLRQKKAVAAGGPLRIAPLPAEIPYAQLLESAADAPAPGLLLGLAEGTRPLFMYPAGSHLVVLGPRRSGRSNALSVGLLETLRREKTQFAVANPRRSPGLRDAALKASATYAERLPEVEALFEAVTAEIQDRQREYVGGKEIFEPYVIVIDDIDVLDIPPMANDALQQVALRGADLGLTLMIAADAQALRSSYPSGVTRALLNQRTGILLAPSTPEDFDFFGVRGKPSRQPPGRGYYCAASMKHSIQVALLSTAEVPA